MHAKFEECFREIHGAFRWIIFSGNKTSTKNISGYSRRWRWGQRRIPPVRRQTLGSLFFNVSIFSRQFVSDFFVGKVLFSKGPNCKLLLYFDFGGGEIREGLKFTGRAFNSFPLNHKLALFVNITLLFNPNNPQDAHWGSLPSFAKRRISWIHLNTKVELWALGAEPAKETNRDSWDSINSLLRGK